jgi:hypothetical protein
MCYDFQMGLTTKSIDACSAGVGDLAVGLWIAEGARQRGEEVLFVSGTYDVVVQAFGHNTIPAGTEDCMHLGGASKVYHEELNTSCEDVSPRPLRWQRTLGWDFEPCRPKLTNISQEAIDWAAAMTEGQAIVVVAPRAAHGSRSLPIHKWIRTCWALQGEGVRTLAIDREKGIVDPFPLYAFGYGWQHILALLSVAGVAAGNDSGISHLAAAIGVPTVVAMGPTIESIIFGHCKDVVRTVAYSDIDCLGCHFRYDRGYRVSCDHGCEALSMIAFQRLETEILRALGRETGGLQGASEA